MTVEELHAPHLAPLFAADDWAALARYWIAHQHKPALDAAIAAARRLASCNTRWVELPTYLEKVKGSPFDSQVTCPEALFTPAVGDDASGATLAILNLHPLTALCEMAGQFPLESQERLLRKGLESTREAAKAAIVANDSALTAFFIRVLARTLKELGQLEKATKLYRQAVAHYQQLAKSRPQIYGPDLALTLNNLGTVQVACNDLESAQASFEQGLDAYVDLAVEWPRIYPPYVASTLNNLGGVQSDLNDFQAALDSFQRSLRIYREMVKIDPDCYRPRLATCLNNLGNTQRNVNALEHAAASYKEAVQIRRELARAMPDLSRPKLAQTLNNLGTVEFDLKYFGAARVSFKKGLCLYRKLASMRPATYRQEVAMTLGNLGSVQIALKTPEAARESHSDAAQIYRELAEASPDVYKPDFAMALNNLGNAQSHCDDFAAAHESYARAEQIYRELAVARPNVYKPFVAGTLNNAGNVQRSLGKLDAARASYEEAARLYSADPMARLGARVPERQRNWTNLGTLFRTKSESSLWPEYSRAREALREAVRCAEDFRGRMHDRALRNAMQAQMLQAYDLLIQTCVDLWDHQQDFQALEEAVHVAEQSRARNLIERLSEEDFAPRNVPPERFATFLRLRRELEAAKLGQELESLGVDARGLGVAHRLNPPAAAAEKHLVRLRRVLREFELEGSRDETETLQPSESAWLLTEAEARYASLVAEMRQADPEWEPDRPVTPLRCADIQALIPADVPTAFVQFTLASETGLALVVTRGGVECVKLPALTDRAGAEAANAWFAAYSHRRDERESWERGMDELLAPIGRALWPLWRVFTARGVRRVVLSPNRWLHIFPLQACKLPGIRRRVADAFDISITPSFSVLGRCADRNRAASGSALIIGDPTSDLLFAKAEVASAKCHYPEATVLMHATATKDLILSESPTCRLFLYTGHATFDSAKPVHSALVLETKDATQRAKWLSLGDAFCRLNLAQCALAILNGCESGMLLPDRTDEYLALSSGFLHAGAVCVLSTLWAVHDLSAALLMDRFHAEWLGGKSVAAALREAARWLREDIRSGDDLVKRVLPEFLREIETDTPLYAACIARAEEYAKQSPITPPFVSPAHWAAFTAVGKAW